MNTHEGYSKKKLSNDNVLLAGGGEKSLAEFLGGIRISSSKIQYKTADTAATWTDLITLVNTDENVKLVDNNADANIPILLKNGTGTGTITSTVRTVDGVTINPKNNALSVSGYINGKILINGGAYSWYSFQQYNSSNNNPTWYDLKSAIININSYSGWQPWIRGVDSEKGSWCIGQYTTNFHVAYIAKSNTVNTTTKRWDFGKNGQLTSPNGFVHGGFTAPSGLTKDNYILLAGGGYKPLADLAAALISTVATNIDANYYLTFVDSNNQTANYESVYTNGGIYFNPALLALSVGGIDNTFGDDVSIDNSYNGGAVDNLLFNNIGMFAFGQGIQVCGQGAFGAGYSVEAIGDGAHAVGKYTKAYKYSHAEGYHSAALNDYSHAEGYYTSAEGEKSHAEGHYSRTTRTAAHAEGFYTVASGLHSHAEGKRTTSSGEDSHAEGDRTISSGTNSHAEGYGTTASANSAHAEGYNTSATNDHAHSEGLDTHASGVHSHAEGYATIASGGSSHAEGAGCEARGLYSHAQGYHTITTNNHEFACGHMNASNDGTRFSIGIGGTGTNSSGRRNIMEVLTATDVTSRLSGGIVKIGTEYEDSYEDDYQTRLYLGGCLRITGAFGLNDSTQAAKRLIYFGDGDNTFIGEDFFEDDYDSNMLYLFGSNGTKVDGGDIFPVHNNIDLGIPDNKWHRTYTQTLNCALTGGTRTKAGGDQGSSANPRYFPEIWKFNTNVVAVNGDIITIKTPGPGHDYGVFLSIDNGSHYYPITLSGTGRMTTHFGTGSYITLLFDSTNSAGSVVPLAGNNNAARTTISGGTWRLLNNHNDGNNYHAVCTTAAGTAAKYANSTNFVLRNHCTFTLYLNTANTYAGPITLNVQSTGAKAIYINGSASSSTNYTLPAGSYFVYYNGTNYYLRTDGLITANITGSAGTLAKIGAYTSSSAMSATSHYNDGEGLTWRTLYNASGPTTYGNVITIGNTGKGQLCLGWSGSQTKADGTDTNVGILYYRSKKDSQNGWTTWKLIAYTSDLVNTQYYLTLNGSNKGHTSGTNLGSFYAPTGAGTNGLYLKSNGSGAPSWTNFPTIPTIKLNGSTTTSPNFYAPTSSGTSGQILKSNGANAAPSWISNSHTLSIASTNDNSSITLAHSTKYKLTAGGSTYVFTTPGDNNTDTKVTQVSNSSNSNRPLLMKYGDISSTSNVTNSVYYNTGIYANPSTSTVTASYFNGIANYLSSYSVTNLDSGCTNNGFYYHNNEATGKPSNQFGNLINFSNKNICTPGTAQHWIQQIDFTHDGEIWHRQSINGGWTTWHKFFKSYHYVNMTSSTTSIVNDFYQEGVKTFDGGSYTSVNGRPFNSSNFTLLNVGSYASIRTKQLAFNYNSNYIKYRRRSDDTWSDWVYVLTLANLGYNTDATNKNYKVQIDSSGNLYVNVPWSGSSISKTTSLSGTTYVAGTSSNQTSFTTCYYVTQFYFTSSGAYHTSDIRKKYDIRDILNEDVNRLFETENGFIRHYKWKETDKDAYGFIAQELEKYCPEAIDFNNDTGYYAVNYNVALSKIVGVLFKKIKLQDLEIKKLKETIENRK